MESGVQVWEEAFDALGLPFFRQCGAMLDEYLDVSEFGCRGGIHGYHGTCID
jgi:hypothetical protein